MHPVRPFLVLGVEQAAHAAAEMRDMARDMPKALATAIGVAFVIGLCVLLIATAGPAPRLAAVDDPLFAAITTNPARSGSPHDARGRRRGAGRHPRHLLLTRVRGLAAVLSPGAGRVSVAVFRRVNARQAPAPAVYLVAVIALATAAFPPNSAMVVFIFLISVSHVLLLAAFLRFGSGAAIGAKLPRAGGSPVAVLALVLSLTVMVSCYQLEVRALQIAIAAIVVLIAQFCGSSPRVRVT